MRTVTYFQGGTVADFSIPDELFEEFVDGVDFEIRYAEGELEKAQKALEAFLSSGDGETTAGANEIAAACFVWNFFNTNPDVERVIEGDVIIIDLDGDGSTIEYSATADIQMSADH